MRSILWRLLLSVAFFFFPQVPGGYQCRNQCSYHNYTPCRHFTQYIYGSRVDTHLFLRVIPSLSSIVCRRCCSLHLFLLRCRLRSETAILHLGQIAVIAVLAQALFSSQASLPMLR